MARKSEVMMDLIHRRQFSALPGVEEFVRTLWRRLPAGHLLGALREEIEAMLEGISLRDCFPIITAAEDVTVGKPDPSGYLQTMKQVARKSRPQAGAERLPDRRRRADGNPFGAGRRFSGAGGGDELSAGKPCRSQLAREDIGSGGGQSGDAETGVESVRVRLILSRCNKPAHARDRHGNILMLGISKLPWRYSLVDD